MIDPSLLQFCQLAVCSEAFNGLHIFSGCSANRNDARANRLPFKHHRTGTTLRNTTGVLGARQTNLLTDHPKQGRSGVNIDAVIFTINF